MKKYINANVGLTLLFFLVLQIQALGQDYTQKVMVKLYDPFNKVPIAKASVTIDLRVVEVLPNGGTYMHAVSALEGLNITGITNAAGEFEAIIPARGENNYVTVRAIMNGYATMVNMATKLERRAPCFIPIEMLPEVDDAAAQNARTRETLDDFIWSRKLELEKEKIDHGYFYDQVENSSEGGTKTAQNADARTDAVAASCVSFNVPVTVRVTGLVEGYSGQCGGSGYTGNLNFDDYIAGVIAKEMGSSFPSEALKAQSVAARTFSLNNIENGRGANCGHAYTFNIPQKCIDAAKATSGVVAIYNNNAISAYYSARCHGDYTRSAAIASCYLGTPSSAAAYCKSVACSGHANCSAVEGGSNCCTKWNSERSRNETVFGHGVGLCQRGAQGFANNGWGWEQIVRRFYSNISLSCGGSCPSSLSLTSTIGSGTFKASGSISASAALASDATVTLDAGNSIVLNIGFSANYANGNSFTAKLGGCSSSNIAADLQEISVAGNLPSPTLAEEEEFKIYPNPSSTGQVIIAYSFDSEENVSIAIVNMMGETIQLLPASGEQLKQDRYLAVNTSGIPPGMYFIVIRSSAGKRSKPLLIK